MATRMQQRRGTAVQWSTANPILAAGEIGITSDTRIIKVGDGTTAWNALAQILNLSYLGITAKAADSNLLDGLDSTAFLLVGAKAADANLLDGLDSTAFVLVVDDQKNFTQTFLFGVQP